MRRFCQGIAGVVLVAAVAGCSDTGPQDGKVPFKGTSTEGLTSLKNQMSKNANALVQKELEANKAKESKPAEAKPAEAKPAEAKPAEAKPAEAKPAEAKPASKSG
jgi:cell division septation protein DedD